MEILLNTLTPLFEECNWYISKSSHDNNKICYKSSNPYDEFIIEMITKSNEFITIVPIDNIPYKKIFINMNTLIDYMKMHLMYYENAKK
jgi:hypothetical protein